MLDLRAKLMADLSKMIELDDKNNRKKRKCGK